MNQTVEYQSDNALYYYCGNHVTDDQRDEKAKILLQTLNQKQNAPNWKHDKIEIQCCTDNPKKKALYNKHKIIAKNIIEEFNLIKCQAKELTEKIKTLKDNYSNSQNFSINNIDPDNLRSLNILLKKKYIEFALNLDKNNKNDIQENIDPPHNVQDAITHYVTVSSKLFFEAAFRQFILSSNSNANRCSANQIIRNDFDLEQKMFANCKHGLQQIQTFLQQLDHFINNPQKEDEKYEQLPYLIMDLITNRIPVDSSGSGLVLELKTDLPKGSFFTPIPSKFTRSGFSFQYHGHSVLNIARPTNSNPTLISSILSEKTPPRLRKYLLLLYISKCLQIDPLQLPDLPLSQLNEILSQASTKKDLKTMVKESLNPTLFPLDRNIIQLQKDGWQIEITNPVVLQQYQDNPIYAQHINTEIQKQTSVEFNFLFSKDKSLHEEALQILKKITRIKIHPNPSDPTLLSCDVMVLPFYEACEQHLDQKINSAFKKYCCNFAKVDWMNFLGKVASNKAAGESAHRFPSPPLTAEPDISMWKCAIEEGILKSENKTEYIFCSKWERIYLEARYFAKNISLGKTDLSKLLDTMIGYASQPQTNHLRYDVAASSLFSIAVLKNIGNNDIKEDILNRLCGIATEYSADQRQKQVAALMILTYYLYIEDEVSFTQKKSIFRACFLNQLYRSQIPLLKALIERDRFYQEYPCIQFTNALSTKDAKLNGQPEFFLLQGICTRFPKTKNNSLLQENQEFLKNAIAFQDNTWIRQRTYSGGYTGLAKTLFQDIVGNKFRCNDPYILWGFHLVFYGFADLAGSTFESITKLIERFGETNTTVDHQNSEKKLLRAIVEADYYQRILNPHYSVDVPYEQSDLLLLCGSSRMINSYQFTETAELSEKEAEYYTKLLQTSEKIEKRYFWFIARMLSHLQVKQNGQLSPFPLREIFRTKLGAQTDRELLEKLKSFLESVVFLEYDHFPSKEMLSRITTLEEFFQAISNPIHTNLQHE